jgi:hypothetical protein
VFTGEREWLLTSGLTDPILWLRLFRKGSLIPARGGRKKKNNPDDTICIPCKMGFPGLLK